MTYEEFIELAMDPPDDIRPSVFVLHIFRIAQNSEMEYPEFYIEENRLYFTTLDQAKEHLIGMVGSERIYCFQIRQIPLGIETKVGDYSCLWLYGADGVLLDRSYASSIFDDGNGSVFPPFRGRSDNAIRFNKGDIVEYLSGNGSVKLGVVLYQPCRDKDIWNRLIKRHKETDITQDTVCMDYSDDIYIVIDEEYECWGYDQNVPATSILTLSKDIPEDMRERLMAKYEWAKQGN